MDDLEKYKEMAAIKAVGLIQSDMLVGLGTGSTAKYAVLELGRKLREGELSGIHAVPTSDATAALARAQNIPLLELEEGGLDFAIDGADEIDPNLNLVKGLGGALLREKIVELASEQLVIIADYTKLVPKLGRGVVPVELVPFGYKQVFDHLQGMSEDMGASWTWEMRMDGDKLFVTDGGNYLLHLKTGGIEDAGELEYNLKTITGVVESGIFTDMASVAFISSPDGVKEVFAKS